MPAHPFTSRGTADGHFVLAARLTTALDRRRGGGASILGAVTLETSYLHVAALWQQL